MDTIRASAALIAVFNNRVFSCLPSAYYVMLRKKTLTNKEDITYLVTKYYITQLVSFFTFLLGWGRGGY